MNFPHTALTIKQQKKQEAQRRVNISNGKYYYEPSVAYKLMRQKWEKHGIYSIRLGV